MILCCWPVINACPGRKGPQHRRDARSLRGHVGVALSSEEPRSTRADPWSRTATHVFVGEFLFCLVDDVGDVGDGGTEGLRSRMAAMMMIFYTGLSTQMAVLYRAPAVLPS